MVDIPPESLPLIFAVAGLALVVAEAAIPGAQFIVIGIALLVAGLIGLLIPGAGSPLALALLVGVAGAATYFMFKQMGYGGGTASAAGQTRDSRSLNGQQGHVIKEIRPNSTGRVRLDGQASTFTARPEVDEVLKPGTKIVVTDPGGGSILTVMGLDDEMDSIDAELQRSRERLQSEPDETETETN